MPKSQKTAVHTWLYVLIGNLYAFISWATILWAAGLWRSSDSILLKALTIVFFPYYLIVGYTVRWTSPAFCSFSEQIENGGPDAGDLLMNCQLKYAFAVGVILFSVLSFYLAKNGPDLVRRAKEALQRTPRS